MPYREYEYNGRLQRRWSDYRRRMVIPEQRYSEDYLEAMRQLISRIGRDGFYEFSSTLPMHVVLSNQKHMAAIQAKLADLERQDALDRQRVVGTQLLFPGFETYLQYSDFCEERENKPK